jgi:hypothetical protein
MISTLIKKQFITFVNQYNLLYDKSMGNQYYGGVIWTNHALERMRERGVGQDMVLQAFNSPDRTQPGREKGTNQYQKRFGNSLVTAVGKQNDKNEWIIISAWIDPPLPGSDDAKRKFAYKTYQDATFWRKIWITVKRQLGLSKY